MADIELSNLYLCKDVPFNNTYETTIDFTGTTETEARAKQLAFFGSYKIADTPIDTTYLRLNRKIYVDYCLDDLFGVNYCYLQNGRLDSSTPPVRNSKWYFYFIVDKQYVNEKCTALTLEMDVFQTYMFDYTLGECFVDREHQNRFASTTSFKFNLEPENIEVGKEYTIAKEYDIMPTLDLEGIVWVYIWITDKEYQVPSIQVYKPLTSYSFTEVRGINIGSYCICCPMIVDSSKGTSITATDNSCVYENTTSIYYSTAKFIGRIIDNPYVQSIAYSSVPPEGITYAKISGGWKMDVASGNKAYNIIIDTGTENDGWYKSAFLLLSLDGDIKSYTAFNRLNRNDTTLIPATNTTGLNINNNKNIIYEPKLLISPYTRYTLRIGDNTKILKPELLSYDTFYGMFSPYSGATYFAPKNYANSPLGYSGDSITPLFNNLNLRSDPYKEFMATKKNSYYTGIYTDMIKGAENGIKAYASTGSAAMGIATGIIDIGSTVANNLAKKQDLKEAPATINLSGDDILLNLIYNYQADPVLIKEEILPQFKTRLFNYLYRYGYACNNFKVPDLKSRYWFNFIKMTDVVFNANKVDSDYIDQLKAIYQKGTTIWHFRGSTSDIANYKTNNLLQYGKENVEMTYVS